MNVFLLLSFLDVLFFLDFFVLLVVCWRQEHRLKSCILHKDLFIAKMARTRRCGRDFP